MRRTLALRALCMSCVRGGFNTSTEPDGGRGDLGSGEQQPDMHGQKDLPVEGIDGATPQHLSCAPPTLVGSDIVGQTAEPAMRVGGLELWAQGEGTVRTRRATLQDDFGDWAAVDTGGTFGNPAFFSWQGVEYAMVHRQERPTGERVLDLCTLDPITCDVVTLTYGDGIEVTMDVDGATVAVVGSVPIMLLNIGANAGDADVYQALPAPGPTALRSWTVEPAQPFVDPSIHEDDPALMPDGTLMIVGLSKSGGHSDLWVAHRPTWNSAFTQPRPLGELNTEESGEEAPELFVSPDGRIELFFTSDESGRTVTYQTICIR